MDTVEEHLEKARHNLAFLNTVDVTQDTFADWAIVVLFYRALHLVSAVIHAQGRDHGRGHDKRQREILNIISAGNAQAFARLYNRSRALRYDLLRATAVEYEQLLQSDFEPLVQELKPYLPSSP